MNRPAFKSISGSFKIGGEKFSGLGIASAEALYLIPKEAVNVIALFVSGGLTGVIIAIVGGGAIVGGVVGVAMALLVGLFFEKKPKKTLLPSIAVKDLDESVRRHPDWPHDHTEKDEERLVVVIPRSAVTMIEHRKNSNLLTFTVDNVGVTIEYHLLHGGEVRDYLAAAGWPLKWGEDVVRPENAMTA